MTAPRPVLAGLATLGLALLTGCQLNLGPAPSPQGPVVKLNTDADVAAVGSSRPAPGQRTKDWSPSQGPLAELTAELAALRREAQRAIEARADLVKRCAELEDERDDLRAEVSRLRQDLKGKTGELAQLAKDYDALAEGLIDFRLKALEAEQKSLEYERDLLELELQQAERELDEVPLERSSK